MKGMTREPRQFFTRQRSARDAPYRSLFEGLNVMNPNCLLPFELPMNLARNDRGAAGAMTLAAMRMGTVDSVFHNAGGGAMTLAAMRMGTCSGSPPDRCGAQ